MKNQQSAIEAYIGMAISIVGAAAALLGGTALWVWSLYLIFEHWGTFWAMLAFFLPPMSLCVLFTCYFWGVWYFILAFLAWGSSLLLIEGADRPLRSVGPFLVFTCISTAFAYFAWHDAVGPKEVTNSRAEQIVDDAVVVITLLRADRADPRVAVSLREAMSKLREDFADYRDEEKYILEETIASYLEFENSYAEDFMNYLRTDAVEGEPFQLSGQTQTSYDSLPRQIQVQIGVDADELTTMFTSAVPEIEAFSPDVINLMEARLKRIRELDRENLQKLLGNSFVNPKLSERLRAH